MGDQWTPNRIKIGLQREISLSAIW